MGAAAFPGPRPGACPPHPCSRVFTPGGGGESPLSSMVCLQPWSRRGHRGARWAPRAPRWGPRGRADGPRVVILFSCGSRCRDPAHGRGVPAMPRAGHAHPAPCPQEHCWQSRWEHVPSRPGCTGGPAPWGREGRTPKDRLWALVLVCMLGRFTCV